ncbi:phosphatase PAP2 family protein [Leifsonia sp. Le1]|uniref:phosphatase PAP2 family protein n=1 Tax=Leifsonia sp. Le1 TaxID=3404918 RepID=UPI003EBDEFAE
MSSGQAKTRRAVAAAFWFGIPALVIVAVLVAGWLIAASPGVTRWDLSVLHSLESVQSPILVALSLGLTWLFSPLVAAVVIGAAAVATGVARRSVWPALRLAILVIVPWLGSSLIKALVQRPRPFSTNLPHHLLTATGYSYPSGHTALATAFCLALLVIWGRGRLRAALVVVAISVPLLTAFARMYVGVHNLTDVLASLLYATAAVVLADRIMRAVGPQRFAASEDVRGSVGLIARVR